jgi:hypothetical protein
MHRYGAQIEGSTFRIAFVLRIATGPGDHFKVRPTPPIKAIVFAVAKIDTLRGCSRAEDEGSGDLGSESMLPCFEKLAWRGGFVPPKA